MSLDIRTAIFVAALQFGVSALACFFFAFRTRRRFPGEFSWAHGYTALALSQFLVAFRNVWPHWLSVVFGNGLAAIGVAGLAAGTELFIGLKPARPFYFAMIAATFASALLYGIGVQDAQLRILVLNLACAAEFCVGASRVFAARAKRPKLYFQGSAIGLEFGAGLVFLGRCAALPSINRQDWLRSGPLDLYFILALLVLLLALAFTLRRLVSDRLWGELDAAVAERELLLREMHHRTKNDLALVSSLLSLEEGAGPSSGGAEERLRLGASRVRAIGLVHDMLHALGAVRDVRLDDYLALLAEAFSLGDTRRKVETRLKPLTLDSKRAIQVGLIVNELVTNALRHAFPDQRAGRVLVSLSDRSAGRGGEEIVVEVSDDGVGQAGSEDREMGFGSAIVQGLAADLRGRLERSYEGGTRVELSFPAKA